MDEQECTICADENAGAPLTTVNLQKGCYSRMGICYDEERLCDHCCNQVKEFMHLIHSYAVRGRCTMMRDQRADASL
jgi:hypothetical protein